ncbi:MAG TPA: PKD domain-containing protein, partial [Solirubrobacteraceae bacterium]|nr:PKD domain-containing protein [Solirubrobacteraceae bacterium]
SATAGTAITFDGAHSSDPDDGDTLTYVWSFDDGATATGATVTHAFSTPGVHTATLTVTDPAGLATKQSTTVSVTAPPAPPTTTTSPTTTTTPTSGTITNSAPPHLVVLGKPSVKGNRVTLTLLCTGSTACTGIQVSETANKTKQVASARLSLKPNQTKRITLTLNGKGRGLLAHLGKLRVVITVTIRTAIVNTAQVTLHPPKKPAHRHP